MTQEDKELLLKDLSARLRYGVIVNYKESEYGFHKWKIETLHAPTYSESGLLIETDSDGWIGYTEYKGCGMSSASRALHLDKNLPYLRPMESMTEDERKEYVSLLEMCQCGDVYEYEVVDWLNAHHFDYRGLIEKGLAIEVTEENNPYEK